MKKNNQELFLSLREKYPIFTYQGFDFQIENNRNLRISFDFRIGSEFRFTPTIILNPGKYFNPMVRPDLLHGLIFNIGLIELISYWKSVCSPTIHIKNYTLTKEQEHFWIKLYHKGLGEFFYQNGISVNEHSFITFSFEEDTESIDYLNYPQTDSSNRSLVPIGGGKDSVVTLEKMKIEKQVIPFIINPREASLACARMAGFPDNEDIVILHREIDPLLLELNRKGFLNGHTPFSAMLAFYSLLASYFTNTREIVLSNESSANEPTIPGTEINHQYSKSEEFEIDFRKYVKENMNNTAHYFSYLRPYSELQIAEMFAQYPDYFPVFRSCNVGSKEDKWCCDCPKCLFTAIILAPFIDEKKLTAIFGEDLFDRPSLLPYFYELTGIAENKPFECVGTIEEVNHAISTIKERYKDRYLIKKYTEFTNSNSHKNPTATAIKKD